MAGDMAGLVIPREDPTAEALRAASAKAGTFGAARRMLALALALVLEGMDRVIVPDFADTGVSARSARPARA